MSRLLTVLLSLACVGLALEGGLRLLGFGPPPDMHDFHERIGWVKKPGAVGHRKTSEFDVTYAINSRGLREDESLGYEKPAGKQRLLVLGDSFTLGYTVAKEHVFHEILEASLDGAWEVVNGGTEGYDTTQSVMWLEEEGVKYSPQRVLLCIYQNDIFWNARDNYLGTNPKPTLGADGWQGLPLSEPDPGPAWVRRSGLLRATVGRWMLPRPAMTMFAADALGGREIPMEWAVALTDEPPFMAEPWAATERALARYLSVCRKLGAAPVVLLIPDKAQIDEGRADALLASLGTDRSVWDVHRATRRVSDIARTLRIEVIDPTQGLRAVSQGGTPAYFDRDRHFSPAGNAAVASVLHDWLVGKTGPATALSAEVLSDAPRWPWVVGLLWLLLSFVYGASYRDEPMWTAPLKIGALVSAVAGVLLGAGWVVGLLPPALSGMTGIVVAAVVVVFLVVKTGKTWGTVCDLLWTFGRRGHWYLAPLLIVMVSIGALLVAAASSPLVAPFIYTLF